MRFGELFGKSWQEYRNNFKVFLIIFLLLSVLPTLIYFFVSVPYTLQIAALGDGAELDEVLAVTLNLKYTIPLIIFGLISFVFGLLMSASFLYNALYRKKEMSVKETISGGKRYFWKYLWFSIVFFIFLAGLFILLIIPGIIYLVFWVFASYILVGENKGVLESLKISHNIVKGKWWRVLGISLLFILIIIAISIGFSIVGGIINGIITLVQAATEPSSTLLVISSLISQLFKLGSNLIIAPLSILFFKNFYLDMKGGKSVVKK